MYDEELSNYTVIEFTATKSTGTINVPLDKIFKNRNIGQIITIFTSSGNSKKIDCSGFYYKGQPTTATGSSYWKTTQINRYASMSFIVISSLEFLLINNENFEITKR